MLAVGPLAVHTAVLDETAGRAALELDDVAPLLTAVGTPPPLPSPPSLALAILAFVDRLAALQAVVEVESQNDGGSCHPDEKILSCNGVQTASMSGECADGSQESWDGWVGYEFDILISGKVIQHREYSLRSRASFLGYEDSDMLEKYPQLDCEPDVDCEAYCSDGTWTKDKSAGDRRKALVIAQYVFIFIELTVEAVCVCIAFGYAVFGAFKAPIKTSPLSYFVLVALNANDKDITYTAAGRFVLVLHLIDDLVMIALLMPFITSLNSENISDRWDEIWTFASSAEEILTFLLKIRLANGDLGGPPGAA
ncbi:hypothetical protein THAOC_27631 [Thalassiosira oceanica]|uniref:Ion transport domain-containing protein n=1 Tax=Thalassiosira oceanica TaxID=159749 RepID=K0RVY3_THAOC|nr:hypothetical protein THAOC_27631 [Thalassiosira oceanica]|eukprot:EJK53006.1 hypothetical protein THAOC_27631 [Thalassiosira oceanica]